MPYRQDAFAAGQIYHLVNRGVDGMPIFAKPENYVYLLGKVKSLLGDYPLRCWPIA